MAQKARQVKLSQKSAANEMQALEARSDDELERETKYKSAALSILGARAAERYDATAARDYFRRAIAASRLDRSTLAPRSMACSTSRSIQRETRSITASASR